MCIVVVWCAYMLLSVKQVQVCSSLRLQLHSGSGSQLRCRRLVRASSSRVSPVGLPRRTTELACPLLLGAGFVLGLCSELPSLQRCGERYATSSFRLSLLLFSPAQLVQLGARLQETMLVPILALNGWCYSGTQPWVGTSHTVLSVRTCISFMCK